MKFEKKDIQAYSAFLIFGLLLGWALFSGDSSQSEVGTEAGKKGEPLYWVAPMDPNYRRDKPGKSPMGMDLVPVYEESGQAEHGPGVVRLSPDVVNNLGVRLAEVKRDVLHTEIKTVGYVKYDEDQLMHIHPRVEGWIEKLHVKASGDPVQKGEPLYALYSPPLVNAQEEYLLALGRKNEGLISAAENRLKALQLSNDFIRRLKRDRKVRQTVTFNAPQGGVVDNLKVREGFYVKPGTTLMSIGQLDQVWVEAEVFARQASLVVKGLPVTMTMDYLQGSQWEGRVDYVYPTLDPKTRTLRVRLRFENLDQLLKPNMFVDVKIFADSEEKVLLVPKEAVIRTGSKDIVVLALGDGQFKSIAVKLGASDDRYIEIKEGLTEGEDIVVSAQFLLDSESSKSSDFKRMYSGDEYDQKASKPQSVWVAGKVVSIDKELRKARIEHGAIEEWAWPVMTMKFGFADDVDVTELQAGTEMHMQLSKQSDGRALVTGIHIMSSASKDKTEEHVDEHSAHDMAH